MPQPFDPLALLDDLIGRARKAGADAADGVVFESASLSVAQRLGESEGVERAESRDVGLRVFRGRRQAMVSSTDVLGFKKPSNFAFGFAKLCFGSRFRDRKNLPNFLVVVTFKYI